ncbi:MAG TPA: hypothetical protein VIJ12_05820 [Candidatus Baltobacteraceae bacterium]
MLIPIGLAIGSLLEAAVLRSSSRSIAAALAQPLPVATSWHGVGLAALGALTLGFAISAIGYVAIARLLLSVDIPRPRAALGAIAGASVLGLLGAFLAPAVISSDAYAYAAYGEMAARGIDAYSHMPLPLGDPVFAAAIWQWGNPPPVCVYGPLFVEIARVCVALGARGGIVAQLVILRALAMLALLACVPLAYAAFAPLGRRTRMFAAGFIVLNPLTIWSAAEGHNDALALAIVLAGFAGYRRYGAAVAGTIVALATTIKAPGALAAIGLLAVQRGKAFTGALLGVTIGLGLTTLWFLPGIREIVAASAHGGHYSASVSLLAIGPATAVVIVTILAVCGVRALLAGRADGWILLAIAVWSALPNPQPWYGLWFLPIAALAPHSRAATVVLALSFTTALRYVPDAYGPLGWGATAGLSAVAFAPLLALLAPKSAILSHPR